MKKDNTEYKIGQTVLVDIEPRTDQPAKWVKATYIKRGYHNACVVEFEDGIYAYPEKLVKQA